MTGSESCYLASIDGIIYIITTRNSNNEFFFFFFFSKNNKQRTNNNKSYSLRSHYSVGDNKLGLTSIVICAHKFSKSLPTLLST